ncbi:MAG: HAMP domain-containing sensor histidine kinase [Bdellovibrionota bacterium]
MRIRSFKSQLLATIITGYVILWSIFCVVVILNFREDTARLFHTQREWLTLYTRTFLNDLKQGNSLAVEQKLKILVNKKIFSEARLSYGNREIRVQGTHTPPAQSSWALSWLLPDTKVVTPVRDDSLSEWGVLEASLSPEFLLEPIRENINAFIQQTGALFFFLLAGLLWMVDRQTAPLQTLTRYIRRFATRKNNSEAITSMLNEDVRLRFSELELLLEEFQSTIKNLLALQEEIRRQRSQTEASKLAAQVAHDIRSPLSALSLATSDLQAVPEEKRILIRAAVNRINDIANELLERYRSLNTVQETSVTQTVEASLELLPILVDGVISEKRTQYKARSGLSFDLHLNQGCYGVFAEVNAIQFTRIVSNLINNAVDAIEEDGYVEVHFGGDAAYVSIRVEDNGKGVDKALIPNSSNAGNPTAKNRAQASACTTLGNGSKAGVGLSEWFRLLGRARR